MYIWNARALRARLAAGELGAREQLGYLLLVLSVLALTFVSVPQHNLWSLVFGVSVLLLLSLGVFYAYLCNGGASGKDFAGRFVALTCVCGVRWVVFLVVPIIVTAVAIPGSPWTMTWPGDLRPLGPFDVVVRVILVPPFLWSVGSQLRAVLEETLEASSAEVGDRGAPAQDAAGLEPLED